MSPGLLLALLGGCQVDPLVVAGIAPRLPPPPPAEASAEPTVSEAEDQPEATPPPSFSPVSVPQGPREEGGVKWQGVTGKFEPTTQEDREMYKAEKP